MTRYEKVVSILDQSIGGPKANIGAHGPFWRGLTRDQFVVKKVYTLPLLVVGNGAGSNLIKAVKGEAPFGADLPNPPVGATMPRMPDGFPPISDSDIAFIQEWIDDCCPQDPFVSIQTVSTLGPRCQFGSLWRRRNCTELVPHQCSPGRFAIRRRLVQRFPTWMGS